MDLHTKPKFEPWHLWTSVPKISKSICFFILKKLQDLDMVEGKARMLLYCDKRKKKVLFSEFAWVYHSAGWSIYNKIDYEDNK